MAQEYVIGVLMRVEDSVGKGYLDKKLAGELKVETRILNDDEIYGVGDKKFEIVTKAHAETNIALDELKESLFLEDILKANGNNEGIYYLYLMNMEIGDNALSYEYTTEVEETEVEVEEFLRNNKGTDSDEIDIDELSEMYGEGKSTNVAPVVKRVREEVIADYTVVDYIMDSLLNNTLLDVLEDEEIQLLTFDLLEVKY